jgi:parvulin-like peptidyl-prolyl isomerase
MVRHCSWWMSMFVVGLMMAPLGCASSREGAMPFAQRAEMPADEDDPLLSPTLPAEPARISRAQRPDLPDPVKQTSLSDRKNPPPALGKVRVSVRAWVNEKPIFDDEVRSACYPYLMEISQLSEPQRSAKQVEIFKRELDGLIDREVILQDVYRKLEKNQKVLDKLNTAADKEFDKQLANMRKRAGVKNDDELKELIARQGSSLETMRKQFTRSFLSSEYMKSRIITTALDQIGHLQVEEYYRDHLNEFRKVDGVKWQDLFIALGPKHPTVADAQRSADQLIARLKRGEDFKKLVEFDDGDSRYRGGDGYGTRKGEIKPAELEPYLFRMKDGEIGPLVALSTGVHVFRLVKREYAGQMPFDQKVQQTIINKLKNEAYAREYKKILNDLKGKAVIEIVRDSPK